MSYFTTAGSAYQTLLAHLNSGQSGRLTVGQDDNQISVYVQAHTLLYATSPLDDAHLVRRLHVAGLVNRHFYDELLAQAIMGNSIFDTLYSNLPESALEQALSDRFNDNLIGFITTPEVPIFTEVAPDFVDNMQMISDWTRLLERCVAIADQAVLIHHSLSFTRGAVQPTTHQRRTIRANVREQTPLQDVIESIPLDPMSAKALLVEMVQAGELDCIPALLSREGVAALFRPLSAARVVQEDDEEEDDDDSSDFGVLQPVPNLDHLDEDESITVLSTDDDWIQAEVEGATPSGSTAPEESGGPSSYTDWMANVDLVEDDELAAFSDNESDRSAGSKKESSKTSHLRESIDVSVAEPEPAVIAQVDDEPIETEEVSASYSAPEVEEDDAISRINQANERLAVMANFLNKTNGPGAGRAAIQLLVDSTGPRSRALFSGVQLQDDGTLPLDSLLDNLYERPAREHFQLVSTGLIDLIERALSAIGDELADDDFDDMYEAVAGYRKALGV